MSNFIDNDISLFINNKNKDKFFKDFNDSCKDKKRDFNDKKRDFNDNLNNITVSLFTGIENNISIYIMGVFIQIMMIKINILYISMIL